MLRKIALFIPVSVLLTACDLVTTPINPNDVVADTQKICGFISDLGPIEQIIAKSAPGLSTADAVAEAICAAIPTKATAAAATTAEAKRALVPMVAGVRITGRCQPKGCT
jgi:hypothetical protein